MTEYSKGASIVWYGQSKRRINLRTLDKKLKTGEISFEEYEDALHGYKGLSSGRVKQKKGAFSRSGSGIDHPDYGFGLCGGILGMLVIISILIIIFSYIN